MEQTSAYAAPVQAPAPVIGRVTLWQTIASVAASFFGVQSLKNRDRDFQYGNAWAFIGVGVAMTAAFILVMLLIVRIVLRHAGM